MQEESFAARFVVGALATWRVTHLLVEEDGPADAVVRLRERAGDSWVGAGDGLLLLPQHLDGCTGRRCRRPPPARAPLTWLALSGAACLLERVTTEKGELDVLWEQAQEDATPQFDDTDPRLSGGPDRAREASTPR